MIKWLMWNCFGWFCLIPSIWQHLVTLTQTERITVIITTHYIEEARQAHYVGLMRQGRLLAENSPEQLLAQYNMETLEEVFLKLCMTDSSTKENRIDQIAFSDVTSTTSNIGSAGGSRGFDNPALEMDLESAVNNNNILLQNNNNGHSAVVTSDANQIKVSFTSFSISPAAMFSLWQVRSQILNPIFGQITCSWPAYSIHMNRIITIRS